MAARRVVNHSTDPRIKVPVSGEADCHRQGKKLRSSAKRKFAGLGQGLPDKARDVTVAVSFERPKPGGVQSRTQSQDPFVRSVRLSGEAASQWWESIQNRLRRNLLIMLPQHARGYTEVIADAQQDDPVPRLRNPVQLGPDYEVFR